MTRAHALFDRGAPAVAERIRAVLDAPSVEFFGREVLAAPCDCLPCRAIRHRGITCTMCGYTGQPILYPCTCRETRASNIAFARREIAKIDAGILPGPGELTRARLLELLANAVASPDSACAAGPHSKCGHDGATWCPVCGNRGDECGQMGDRVEVEAEQLAARLREIRAMLNRIIA